MQDLKVISLPHKSSKVFLLLIIKKGEIVTTLEEHEVFLEDVLMMIKWMLCLKISTLKTWALLKSWKAYKVMKEAWREDLEDSWRPLKLKLKILGVLESLRSLARDVSRPRHFAQSIFSFKVGSRALKSINLVKRSI